MIDTKSSRCVGCGACEAACPSKCISMEVSESGEYRPVINKNMCVGCNLCEKVCLINDKDVVSYPIGETYFGWDKNFKARKDSSSGGIANVIAKQIVSTNGVIMSILLQRINFKKGLMPFFFTLLLAGCTTSFLLLKQTN